MQLLYNLNQQKNIRRKLRKNSTMPETIFWNKIRNKQTGFKFRRQYGIDRFITDFCCPELKLIVEIDGDTHAEDKKIEQDKLRTKYFEELGFKVLRYNNKDIMNNIDGVLEDLYKKLKKTPHPPSP